MTLRYRFIAEHRADYGVQRLCRVLAVFAYLTYYNTTIYTRRSTTTQPTKCEPATVRPTPSRHETPVTGPRVEPQEAQRQWSTGDARMCENRRNWPDW
jgi:hypothetical protein